MVSVRAPSLLCDVPEPQLPQMEIGDMIYPGSGRVGLELGGDSEARAVPRAVRAACPCLVRGGVEGVGAWLGVLW